MSLNKGQDPGPSQSRPATDVAKVREETRPSRPGAAARTRRLRPRTRGQAIVELALVLPGLLVLLAAGADLARLFHSQVSIESAARAGALEAAQHPTSFQSGQACNTTTNRVMCAVMTESSGSFLTIAASDVNVSCSPSLCAEALGNTVTVYVVGHFSMLTPILSVLY
ncbi:MAG TPA: TadE/TadG family type IV pilus assembly protein, partial [Candidatus Limnocylindrales bacterium]|nr:TadE/TadG family type IV pilus assembly protein [Candidatus Limnocylindrales bacterium]